MKVLVGLVIVLGVLLAACGGGNGDAPSNGGEEDVLPAEFKNPESAIKKLFEYVDREQWDLQYAPLLEEHKERCSFDLFNNLAEENVGSAVGRVKVKSVEEVREVDEWQGFRNVVAITVVLEGSRGGEKTEKADTFYLVKRSEFYYWLLPNASMERCERAG